jgi:predicted permease
MHALLVIAVVISVGTFLSWLMGLGATAIMKVSGRERGLYLIFSMFSNNGFLGLPVSYALFGAKGLFLMTIANCVSAILLYTWGVILIRGKKEKGDGAVASSLKENLRNFFSVPIVSSIAGILIFLFQVPMPGALSDVLLSIGNMMTPLSMIVIGLQLTESRPGALIKNQRLLIMSFLRLFLIPAVIFAILFPMYLGWIPFKITGLVLAISLVNFMTPFAAVTVALAEEYDNDPRLAAEGVFLSTLFSMATIPLGSLFLSGL